MSDSIPFLTTLSDDHALLDRAAGSLRTLTQSQDGGIRVRERIVDMVSFLRTFLSRHHHIREEALFQILEDMGLPGDRGPLLLLKEEHREMEHHLETLHSPPTADEAGPEGLRETARILSHLLWEHMDKEDWVFIPEVERRLRPTGSARLQKISEEAGLCEADMDALRRSIETLVLEFPPISPDVIRGGGCIQCRHFGLRCDGMEHEWWTEEDWRDNIFRMQGE